MRVLLESGRPGEFGASWRFDGLVRTVTAETPADVLPALAEIETAVSAGYHAAGYLGYEAASGLIPHLATMPAGNFPLLSFGIFRERISVHTEERNSEGEYGIAAWESSLSADEHAASVDRIRELIAAGDTYQVNFTFRRRFRFRGDPFAWYRDLRRSQPAPFNAFLHDGRFALLSASPELFFSLHGGELTVRPMKGTAARRPDPEEDHEAARRLSLDPKERAENLMIVDLLRNDLGMISRTGSVRTESLFDVETLPTVHQMTSTVRSQLARDAGLIDIFRALFPCGSVTGAPKRRTMEIIAGLEGSSRGPYTGCIGYISPGPEAVFSVAIRTAVVDFETGRGELGIGSGVTWDSRPDAEYAECRTKARFAEENSGTFRLIESLLLADGLYPRLDRHLGRLARSAAHFGFSFNQSDARRELALCAERTQGKAKVRFLLSADGGMEAAAVPLGFQPEEPLKVALSHVNLDPGDPFLYHKTTLRELYERELSAHAGADEVLLVNERGEVTEGCFHSVAVEKEGRLVTPPLSCGLLPGVMREELLEHGELTEGIVTPADLRNAGEFLLFNSVRGIRRAVPIFY